MTARFLRMSRLDRISPHVVAFLDADRLWVAVFFVGMVVSFALSYNSATTAHRTSLIAIRSAAARDASITAQANVAYTTCIGSRPLIQKFSTYVKGTNEFVEAAVMNAAASAAAIGYGDPEYATRRDNLLRLIHAEHKIQVVQSVAVPTVQQCEDKRDEILGKTRPPRTGRVH